MKLWKLLRFGQVSVTVSKAINGSELTVNRNLLAAVSLPYLQPGSGAVKCKVGVHESPSLIPREKYRG